MTYGYTDWYSDWNGAYLPQEKVTESLDAARSN